VLHIRRGEAFTRLLLLVATTEAAIVEAATLLVAVLIGTVAARLALLATLIGLGLLLIGKGRPLDEGLWLALGRRRLSRLGHKARLGIATLLGRVGLLAGAIGLLLEPLGRGSEAIRQSAQIIIIILIELRRAFWAIIAHLGLLLGGLGRCDQAEIMLGMLEIALGHHRVAGRLGIARELQIFLSDVMGCTANFHVRAVGFIGPRERIRPLAVVATAHTLVLTWSH